MGYRRYLAWASALSIFELGVYMAKKRKKVTRKEKIKKGDNNAVRKKG
jgi:hypothetical protein